MQYGKKEIDGINIFYREAVQPDKPTLVLFHGFPSAGHMFRDLIPMLAEDFHMIAPDYPGFGQSDAPDRTVMCIRKGWGKSGRLVRSTGAVLQKNSGNSIKALFPRRL